MYSSQASVAHLPHPVIAYSWDTARNFVAYPVISYPKKALPDLEGLLGGCCGKSRLFFLTLRGGPFGCLQGVDLEGGYADFWFHMGCEIANTETPLGFRHGVSGTVFYCFDLNRALATFTFVDYLLKLAGGIFTGHILGSRFCHCHPPNETHVGSRVHPLSGKCLLGVIRKPPQIGETSQ